jgi:dCMP deaminase
MMGRYIIRRGVSLPAHLTSSDQHFLDQCDAAKEASHDPIRKVGAVIVGSAGQIVATGANRPPEGIHLDRQTSFARIAADTSWKYFMLEHAERNAIALARNEGHMLRGTTMYSSLFPCADCARAIVAAGIGRLVAPNFSGRAEDEKWQEHFKYAVEILRLGGVQLDFAHEKEQEIAR